MFDDDFLRRLREMEEMARRLGDGPLRFLRENEAAIERAAEHVRSIDTSALAAVQALETERALSRAAEFTELSNVALVRLAQADSVAAMELYANQHREIQETVWRLALPHKSISEHALALSATIEATHLAGIVRLTLRPAQCRDEHSPAPLPSASLSARNHQPCRLALPQILPELPGC